MNLTSLRAAVVVGTCAVALSFITLPAWASDSGSGGGGGKGSSASAGDSSSDDSADADEDESEGESTDETTDDSVTGVDDSDDDGVDGADDDTADAEDGSDDLANDASATPSLPVEQGDPALRLARSTISPTAFAEHGVIAVASGLTPGARYQPFWSTNRMGDTIKGPRKADRAGTLTFTWKPDAARAGRPATWTVGLGGVDTELENLTRTLEVRYDSDLTWQGSVRHGKAVTLAVSLDREAASGKDRAWRKVPVAFQKRVGDAWVTVRTRRTNGDGVATATVKADRSTVWRAVVDATGAVSGSATSGRRR